MRTNETTTATITWGVTVHPVGAHQHRGQQGRGQREPQHAAHIAPMPMPMAGARSIPGRPLAAMPSAAPMNMDGNTGPPRNALSDSPYASDLQMTEQDQAPIEYSAAFATRLGRASWPENSISVKLSPVRSW